MVWVFRFDVLLFGSKGIIGFFQVWAILSQIVKGWLFCHGQSFKWLVSQKTLNLTGYVLKIYVCKYMKVTIYI